MSSSTSTYPELPDIITLISEKTAFHSLEPWRNILYSVAIIALLTVLAVLASRKRAIIPGRLQSAAETVAEAIDSFVCELLGKKGRKYTPFLGTLFLYILFMNLSGLVPFIKTSTASFSTTLALAICVFVYVQYTAFRELGFIGFFRHLAGNPKGALAWTVIFPVFMFVLHTITELIRPLSLSLRLRGNMFGDEMLFAVMAGFGFKGIPILFFNMAMALIAAVIQAAVFMILSAVYFALILVHDEETG